MGGGKSENDDYRRDAEDAEKGHGNCAGEATRNCCPVPQSGTGRYDANVESVRRLVLNCFQNYTG
jgi:hypothetical protein